ICSGRQQRTDESRPCICAIMPGRRQSARVGEIARAKARSRHGNSASLSVPEGEGAGVTIDDEDAILAAVKGQVYGGPPPVPAPIALPQPQLRSVNERECVLVAEVDGVVRQRQPIDVAALV